MPEDQSSVCFRAWGKDNIAYGPVELPGLVNWIREGRVTRDAWVFQEAKGEWSRASEIPELKILFKSKDTAGARGVGAASGITPGSLRRIKILASMDERLLAPLLQYLEVLKLPANTTLVRKGEHADAMFFVVEGELRARVMVAGKESTLTTMGAGECFGELALMDHGPRSGDVVSNQESTLLKISAASLKRLFDEAPALAAPLLMALSRAVTARIRALTKRYEDSINFARTASRAGQSA
jgi:CRP/FNR family transcriptional regulator, cyclic AMP receptor protein